jgi:hypothetical protein
MIFENLAGRVTSTCLGLTCRAFYEIHWSIHKIVPLWAIDKDDEEELLVSNEEGDVLDTTVFECLTSWFAGDASSRLEESFLWQYIDKWGGGGKDFKIHCPCLGRRNCVATVFVTESQWKRRLPCREHRHLGGRSYGHFLVGGDIVVASAWKSEEGEERDI